MTTIRISRLPEIKNDRVSADDYLIINDGDIVTSKVTFEEFVYAISAQDIEFTGDLLYTGDVVFEGDITGDFYHKDEVYTKSEVDQLIKNLAEYNVIQDARIVAIETLIGRPSLSTDLGIFPGNVIPDNCTIVEAFQSIEEMLMDHEFRITQNYLDIIDIKQDIVEINEHLTSIDVIIDGLNGPQPPNTIDPPDSGIINQLNWLIAKVQDHEIRIVALEVLIQEHEVKINDLRDEVDILTSLGKINDAENANLITLTGVLIDKGPVESVPIVSTDLGDFNYTPPYAAPKFNNTFPSTDLNGTTIKVALQKTLTEVQTRAPIKMPVFEAGIGGTSGLGQKFGITGPPKAPSMIPNYHTNISNLNSWKLPEPDTDVEGSIAACEGSFAYINDRTGLNSSNTETHQGAALVRNQTEWVELLTTKGRGIIWQALGLVVARHDTEAQGLGVPAGYVYVQKDNPSDLDEDGWMKVNGVNTSNNPRPNLTLP